MIQRLWLFIALLGLTTLSAFAQDQRKPEVFIGYSNLQGEGLPGTNDPNDFLVNGLLNRRTTLHGGNAAITLFPTETFGITGDVSFNRKRKSLDDLSTGSHHQDTDVWYLLAGPSYVFQRTGRVQPFARILAGAAHTRFEARTEGAVAGGTVASSFDVGSWDFALGAGGGLDVRVGDKVKLRVLQIDWTPVFLGDRAISVLGNAGVIQPRTLEGQRQDNVRFSFGVTF